MKFKQLSKTIPIEFGKQFISFITGEHNDHRISLQYHFNETSGSTYALVTFGRLAQGPPGHAHGGAISAVFDELMGACCWVNGYPAMTAQYTTRFFKPVPLHEEILFCAEIKKKHENKINLRARLVNPADERYAEARGLFILQDMATFEKMSQLHPESINHLRELAKHS